MDLIIIVWILKKAYTKKPFNVERITGPAPLTGSAPKVDGVYPVPRPVLRPSFVEIRSVVSVKILLTNQPNNQTELKNRSDICCVHKAIQSIYAVMTKTHKSGTYREARCSQRAAKKRPQQLIFIVM